MQNDGFQLYAENLETKTFLEKKLSNFRIGNFLPFIALKDEIKHKILYFKISTIKSVLRYNIFSSFNRIELPNLQTINNIR